MIVIIAQILWQAPRLLPLAIVAAAVTLVAVAVLYAPQSRRLRQPWRWGLPLLRLCVGLALAASLLQPALVRSDSEADRGAIVVLADASRSMGVVDARSPAELVALADALGMLPAGARQRVAEGLDDELAALLKSSDNFRGARDDVEYAKLAGQGVIAAQTRLDDVARQLAAAATRLVRRGQAMPAPSDLGSKLAALAPPAPNDAAGIADYRNRISAAAAALDAAQAAADAELYARPDVKPACDAVTPMSRAQLVSKAMTMSDGSTLASIPASGTYAFTFADALRSVSAVESATSQPAIDPAGFRSDIAGALRSATERMKGRIVQAVVVLSDGRQVGGEGAVSSSLAPGGVPVYAVSVAPPNVRDVSIAGVSLPSRQFTGEHATARVHVRGTGMKGSAVEVKLEADGVVQQTKNVMFGDNPAASVDFALKFATPGPRQVTITAAPQLGEATAANNAARRWLTVMDDRTAVALVGASASWGFQATRAALARAPWMAVDAEVLDAPGARWSKTASSMMQLGAVVLCDVMVEHLSPEQWDTLYRFVVDRGGSLIIVAGTNTASPKFIDSPLLTDLLPFRGGVRPAWRTWAGDQPLFRFSPAPVAGTAAGDAAMLRLADDAASSLERWLELPAMFQYLPVTDLKPNAIPLLVERESGAAVLTEARLGLGRVLFFGANETYRWRRLGSAVDHDRFWLQLIRHATDEPYAARRGAVALDADAMMIQPGQPLRVRARVSDPDELPATDESQTLLVRRDGKQVATILLAADGDEPGRYGGTFADLKPGSYELVLPDPYDDASAAAVLPVHVEPDVESEMRDVSGDEQALRRLAESTGGQFLHLADWASLPNRLQEAHRTSRRVAQQSLWDSPLLFAFVLGCLGIEWSMRKRLGLA